jgi:hypothetical protein
LVRWVSCFETEERGFYGIRVGSRWYQGRSSEVRGKGRCGTLFRLSEILMLRRYLAEGRMQNAECRKPRKATEPGLDYAPAGYGLGVARQPIRPILLFPMRPKAAT